MKSENIKTTFNSFNESKSKKVYTLTQEEKEHLYSKFEYKKKQKSLEKKDEIHMLLTSENDSNIVEETFIKILNSLEYTFKKKMKDTEFKFRKEVPQNIKDKIPNNWVGVKYSSIKAKETRDSKKEE